METKISNYAVAIVHIFIGELVAAFLLARRENEEKLEIPKHKAK